MTRRNALFSSLLLFARKLFAQRSNASAPNDDWKADVGRGVASYKAGQYKDAVGAFARAAALNPNDPIPHIYLGVAWQQQFIPNGRPQESAAHARDEFKRAIALDPSSWPTLIFMARLERDLGNVGEAERWYEQALQLDPANADLYVALGALAMQSGAADRAMTDFQQALELDPQSVFAMRFLDALSRAGGDEAAAAAWRNKADGVTAHTRWPPPLAGTWQIIRDAAILNMALPAPPPPPPPPPPPGSRGARQSSTTPTGWVFRHVPDPDGDTPPMLVHPIAQERMLLRKIDPVFLRNASGTARIGIVVAKDGTVRKAIFVDGNPALAEPGLTAVRQWVYRPTISNWEPVEVRSEVLLQADLQ